MTETELNSTICHVHIMKN